MISLGEFILDLTPFVHDVSWFVDSGFVESDIGDDWDSSKGCNVRHDLEMFFNIYNISEII